MAMGDLSREGWLSQERRHRVYEHDQDGGRRIDVRTAPSVQLPSDHFIALRLDGHEHVGTYLCTSRVSGETESIRLNVTPSLTDQVDHLEQ